MTIRSQLHFPTRRGNLTEIQRLLKAGANLEHSDGRGRTPLMCAAESPTAGVDVVKALLAAGANANAECKSSIQTGYPVLALALAAGDPDKVQALLDAGADLRYRREGGYDALIDLMYGRSARDNPALLKLLRLCIDAGAAVDGRSKYGETTLRKAAAIGRFDAVALLLASGADLTDLRWNELMRAVALGSSAEMAAALEAGSELEHRDYSDRTPWLLAVQTGEVAKAKLLLERGADRSVRGWFETPPLHYAVGRRHLEMARWLLDLGLDPEQPDKGGTRPLTLAAQRADAEMVALLLARGSRVENADEADTALAKAASREVLLLLLAAGADPAQLTFQGQRLLAGLPAQTTDDYLAVTPEQFAAGWKRRFGSANPQEMHEPFWQAMVRSGLGASAPCDAFEHEEELGPVWCAERFGQSITLLPDGTVVRIGGEHEDFYDPNFCIYNDVFVHEPAGGLRIFGYPKALFPPTDFHTATLVDDAIYIIGSLGYAGSRCIGETPVYRLSLHDFSIEPIATDGDSPGWIHRHRAERVAGEIRVFGGQRIVLDGQQERCEENSAEYFLDLESKVWRRG